MNYGSLKCATEYAEQGQIEQWVHDYLLNEGQNKEFSDGLKLYDRYFIGPIKMPLNLFKRCCGPEEDTKYRVDEKNFENHVKNLIDAIKVESDMPPLIANFVDGYFELNDGNHRFEAYSRLGITKHYFVIWITKKSDYDVFTKNYGEFLTKS
jgi:hypothetical protein